MTRDARRHLGLVQMRCSTDPDDNLRRAVRVPPRGRRRGAQVACLPELFRTQYFCQVEDPALVRPRRADPRPDDRGPRGRRPRDGMVVVGSIFERRAAGIYHNTAVVLDADGSIRGPLPQDAHPRRPALLREVSTSPPATSASRRSTPARPRRHARLLGPVVSRGRPADRPEGGRDPVLPHGDRLAPGREGRVRRGPGRRLGDHAAGARHQQRRVRRGRQPGRPRRARPTAASSSGAARSSPTPSAASSPGPAATPRRSSIVDLRPPPLRRRPAATGRSSATAGSTPTARSPSASCD